MIQDSSDFFQNRKLFFIEPNFWSAEECWQLREISKFGTLELAGIYSDGKLQVDSSFRQTGRIVLNHGVHQEIERSIWTIKSRLEEQFGVSLMNLQGSQLLQYQPGHYFRMHQDEGRISSPGTRKVSVVVFLNSQSTFKGGELVFYESEEDGRNRKSFTFTGEEGMLLGFSPYLFHEVRQVTSGIRFTVVTWFC
jgi:predicted 2-oxoglutarate/Fe(II)-dependent dioxygenase YbiX